ncbi:unnamed protein product [Hermetia illucens]|uniref:Uncharacterized protein n=1 Tax=Hermetia illucens TaxID=343691 RepID=A0A7R8UH96_HERIL|nr:uncharacterized protein LOC119649290 [Hermetia illucens]CAD7080855.1 unnamed protein product [Hermetia illucens]
MEFAIVVLAVVAAASASPVLPLVSSYSSLGVAPGLTTITATPIAPAVGIAPLGTLSPLSSSIALSTPIIKSGIIGAPAVAPLGLGLNAWGSPLAVDLWKKKRAQ